MQILNIIFGYGFLIAMLVFIILIWRSSLQIVSVLKVFSAVGVKNAESSERSAQAAREAAETVKLLASQFGQEKPST